MNPEEKFTITLNIAGQSFRPKIERREEELYRIAEKDINEIYEKFSKRYRFTQDQLLRAIILQFAVGKVKYSKALENFLSKLEDLDLDLEEFLETP